MAFLHLLNCVLLTFAPLFVIFNTTSIHEYGLRVCIGGFFGYIGAAMIKLIAYASLVPISEDWNLISEVLKELISLIDILAISYIFTWKTVRISEKKTKMLGVGLGWAAGQVIFSHLLIFLINASGGEFSWEYLQRAITANCEVFQLITLACLVFIKNYSSMLPSFIASVILIGQVVIKPLFVGYALSIGVLNGWSAVLFQLIWSAAMVLIGKVIVEVSS